MTKSMVRWSIAWLVSLCCTHCIWISFGRDDLGKPYVAGGKLSQMSVLIATNSFSFENGSPEVYTEKVQPGHQVSDPVKQAIQDIGFREVHYMHEHCDLTATERTQLFNDVVVPLFLYQPCRNLPPHDALLILPRKTQLEIINNQGGVLVFGDSATTSGLGLDRLGALILFVATLGLVPAQQEESQIVRSKVEIRVAGRSARAEGLAGYRRLYTSSYLSYVLVLVSPMTHWKVRTSKTIFGKSSDAPLDSINELDLQRKWLTDAFRGLESHIP